jgi:hypothetical protein
VGSLLHYLPRTHRRHRVKRRSLRRALELGTSPGLSCFPFRGERRHKVFTVSTVLGLAEGERCQAEPRSSPRHDSARGLPRGAVPTGTTVPLTPIWCEANVHRAAAL